MQLQCFVRCLHALVLPGLVVQGVANELGHVHQQLARAGCAVGAHELAGPVFEQAGRVIVIGAEVRCQHPQFFGVVLKGVGLCPRAQRKIKRPGAGVLNRKRAADLELGGGALWLHQGHRVGVGVLDQANINRLGAHLQISGQHPQVVAVTGAEQHPVGAQNDRLGIPVVGGVGDVEKNRQGSTPAFGNGSRYHPSGSPGPPRGT